MKAAIFVYVGSCVTSFRERSLGKFKSRHFFIFVAITNFFHSSNFFLKLVWCGEIQLTFRTLTYLHCQISNLQFLSLFFSFLPSFFFFFPQEHYFQVNNGAFSPFSPHVTTLAKTDTSSTQGVTGTLISRCVLKSICFQYFPIEKFGGFFVCFCFFVFGR